MIPMITTLDSWKRLRSVYQFIKLHLLPKTMRRETKYHGQQPFIFIIIESNIQYAILIIILGRETKKNFLV